MRERTLARLLVALVGLAAAGGLLALAGGVQ